MGYFAVTSLLGFVAPGNLEYAGFLSVQVTSKCYNFISKEQKSVDVGSLGCREFRMSEFQQVSLLPNVMIL